MHINYIALGGRIRTARIEKGLTQQTLAERINICPSYMSHIENGNSIISLQVFTAIANELDVSADTLLHESLNITEQSSS